MGSEGPALSMPKYRDNRSCRTAMVEIFFEDSSRIEDATDVLNQTKLVDPVTKSERTYADKFLLNFTSAVNFN